jgi:hypothetical protein
MRPATRWTQTHCHSEGDNRANRKPCKVSPMTARAYGNWMTQNSLPSGSAMTT